MASTSWVHNGPNPLPVKTPTHQMSTQCLCSGLFKKGRSCQWQEAQWEAQKKVCDSTLKKTQGEARGRGHCWGCGRRCTLGRRFSTSEQEHPWEDCSLWRCPHWGRNTPEGTAACGGAHARAGTPLRGLWPMEGPTWEQKWEKRSSRKKPPCTNPKLLHHRCLDQGMECNLWGQPGEGRRGKQGRGGVWSEGKGEQRSFPQVFV